MGFRVWGLGFRVVEGSGRGPGLRFRVRGLGNVWAFRKLAGLVSGLRFSSRRKRKPERVSGPDTTGHTLNPKPYVLNPKP